MCHGRGVHDYKVIIFPKSLRRPISPAVVPASARILGPGSRRIMPHPVRDNQATTTPPHQPSPPHPTPAGDPPGRPTSPPAGSPPPRWLPGRSWRAGRPVAQPTLAGWRAGPPLPAHHSRLPPAAPNVVCGQQGQGLFAALGCCLSAAPRHPLPPCARLTGGAWAAGGSGWRSRPPGRPAAGRAGRDLPAPGPAGAFGPPQPQQLFCVSPSSSLPLCTSSAPSAGLTGALVRSGVAELGRGCAGWGGEALARSCAAHVVGSRTDCPHGWGGAPCKGTR